MKDILITGAYGGMGRAVSKLMRSSGYRVFALDIKVGESEENLVPVEVDVRSEESIKAAYEFVKSQSNGLYAILHFAGIYMLDSLVEMRSEEFRRILDVNFVGAFLVNKAFMPLLDEGSRILLTTSELASLDPLPFTGIYAVTKGALDKYAYSLRMELQLLGIKVSVLRAGAVETGMLGVSTSALEEFTEGTKLYSYNANRFRSIVNRVEAKCIPACRLAKKVKKILEKHNPVFAYSINRNPLLLFLNILPKRMQLWVIRRILK